LRAQQDTMVISGHHGDLMNRMHICLDRNVYFA
jgi:hypothetical protein